MSQSRFYSINTKGKITTLNTASEVFTNHKNGEFYWLDYYKPTREELTTLIEPLDLHPLTVEDCTDENLVPKIEEYPNNTFIIFNSYSYIERELWVDEVDFIIGKNYLITVSGYNSNGRNPLIGIEKLVEREINQAKLGPSHLLQIILDHVVDKMFVAIESLEEELDAAEENLINDPATFVPSETIRLRRHLLTLRKSLFHEREILVKICRKDCPFISDSAIYHFRDIYDHLSKFFELTETYREIVSSLLEMNVSMMNNRLTKSANQTNLSVRRLTLISTIFMPLTLLAGIGGMSEWSMMTNPENWRLSYPFFLLGMIIIGALNYMFIKWLERRDKARY
ncbi:MAG: magnesium transporter CorA family protein [Bacteroidales bacterium]|nr:magnesium transporter CorA family protein [Bacteroidales bacterium]